MELVGALEAEVKNKTGIIKTEDDNLPIIHIQHLHQLAVLSPNTVGQEIHKM
jgi:hypothetical protein